MAFDPFKEGGATLLEETPFDPFTQGGARIIAEAEPPKPSAKPEVGVAPESELDTLRMIAPPIEPRTRLQSKATPYQKIQASMPWLFGGQSGSLPEAGRREGAIPELVETGKWILGMEDVRPGPPSLVQMALPRGPLPSGREISQAIGLPEAAAIPLSALDKTVLGIASFMSSPQGATQLAALGVPALKLPVAVKFISDMVELGVISVRKAIKAFNAGDAQGLADSILEATASAEGTLAVGKLAKRVDLPDESRIREAVKEQDVMPGRDWIASPRFEFRKNPIAKELVTKLDEVEKSHRAQTGAEYDLIDDIQKGLSEEQQIRVTSALRENQKGNPELLNRLSPEERTAATRIRDYFEGKRQEIIAGKRQSILDSLAEPRRKALEAIQGGMDAEQAFKESNLRKAGRVAVEDALKEIKDLGTWGPAEYVTNIERGSYRVITDEGQTVAIGETRAEARAKALHLIEENPDIRHLTLDDSFNPAIEFPTKLSRGQYWRMVSRMSEALETDAKAIQEMLRAEGKIVAIKPTSKYSGPLQKRRGILKGEDNIFDAMRSYAYSVNKKLALDPVLRQAQRDLDKLPPNMKKQIGDLVDDVKGQKFLADQIADYLLAPLGTKPFAISRGVAVARNLTSILKLGYRPLTAIVNRLGGLTHTWSKAGAQWLLEGRRFMKTDEFKQLWERHKTLVGIEASMAAEAGTPQVHGALHPLGMFQWAEKINRPEAFATFYQFARNGLEMEQQAALQYSLDMVDLTQFTYNTASLPRVLRGPIGRLVGQFKSYFVKEMEFLSTLRGAEWGRYTAGFLTLGGPRAAIYMLRSLPFIGLFWGLREADEWLNRKTKVASRGLPGFAGVDITAAVTPQLPTKATDWLGPFVGDIARLSQDVVMPAIRGESKDFSDLQNWASRLSPALLYWSKLVESVTDNAGWTTDERGRPMYKPTKADKAKMLVGAKPLEQASQEVETRYLRETAEIQAKNRQRIIDNFLDVIVKKDGAEIQKLAGRFAEFGITSEMVRNAAKQRAVPLPERLFRQLPKAMRPEAVEKLGLKPNSFDPFRDSQAVPVQP